MYLCVCVALFQGDLKPEDAANMMTVYEGKFIRLKEDRDNLIKAKEALELADPGTTVYGEGFTILLEHGHGAWHIHQ